MGYREVNSPTSASTPCLRLVGTGKAGFDWRVDVCDVVKCSRSAIE